jgi:hypothetical protein
MIAISLKSINLLPLIIAEGNEVIMPEYTEKNITDASNPPVINRWQIL